MSSSEDNIKTYGILINILLVIPDYGLSHAISCLLLAYVKQHEAQINFNFGKCHWHNLTFQFSVYFCHARDLMFSNFCLSKSRSRIFSTNSRSYPGNIHIHQFIWSTWYYHLLHLCGCRHCGDLCKRNFRNSKCVLLKFSSPMVLAE